MASKAGSSSGSKLRLNAASIKPGSSSGESGFLSLSRTAVPPRSSRPGTGFTHFQGALCREARCHREATCEEVRRTSSQVASRWHLASRHKAPWKWVNPVPGLLDRGGTAVRLKLKNPLSPLLDPGFIDAALRRNFEPLLDPAFDAILIPLYRHKIEFDINGRSLERHAVRGDECVPLEVRLGRKRKPSAVGA